MTSVAAPGDTAPQPGWIGSWVRRLGIHFLVQLVVAVACVLVLRLELPLPPPQYQLTNAQLDQNGVERPVTLPDRGARTTRPDDPLVYTLSFEAHDVSPDRPWSVLLPRFMNRAEVAVNGVWILNSGRDSVANLPNRNKPMLVVIPVPPLHDGTNTLTVRLFVWGPLGGFLERIYVGPDEALRPAYDHRTWLFVTAPVIFAAWQASLALIVGLIWLTRRHEAFYGVFAAAMALGFLQAFGSASQAPASPYVGWNAVLVASGVLESACVLLFVVTFLGFSWPRWAWAVFAPGILILAISLVGDRATVFTVFVVMSLPTVGLCLIAAWLVAARAAINRLDPLPLLFGCAISVIFICWLHDLLSVLDVTTDGRIFVSRLSYSALLIAIGVGLTWRFAKALNEVDGFASRTVILLRETEARLRATFANEERLARVAALAAERTRLMRDLHDGLGGQLVSIVALSERKGRESDPIGDAARAALRDLRLVVDAMDDINGDLMLALGTWRERAQAQLRLHDMALEWRVLSPSGLPVCPDLRPWHVIQVLRLLDEAVTNAVKHSGAKRVTVSLETIEAAGQSHGRITVSDNGCGFCPPQDGRIDASSTAHRGLTNMMLRAARCDAELDITSGETGTQIRLDLPTRFPAAEDAAG